MTDKDRAECNHKLEYRVHGYSEDIMVCDECNVYESAEDHIQHQQRQMDELNAQLTEAREALEKITGMQEGMVAMNYSSDEAMLNDVFSIVGQALANTDKGKDDVQ